jgi:hypothetical protein
MLHMKLSHLVAIVALTLFATASGYSGPVAFPSEAKALFTLDIPEAWHPKVSDGTLEASAPKDAAYVAVWTVKSDKELKNLDKDIDDILKDSVVEPKMGEPTTKTVNGIEFMRAVGTGKDRKEKTPVTFEVWMFLVKPEQLAVLYFDYDTDATPDMIKTLGGMVGSIKLAK